MTPPNSKPPLYTHFFELVAWSFDRTAGFPKSHRFTVGQRLDNLTLECLRLTVRALYLDRGRKRALLEELNLSLEELRVFWRLAHERRWISQQQLIFVIQKLDEAGRMIGGWLRQVVASTKPTANG